VASADREAGGRDPFRPGRFAGRDRAGRRRLDGDVGLTKFELVVNLKTAKAQLFAAAC